MGCGSMIWVETDPQGERRNRSSGMGEEKGRGCSDGGLAWTGADGTEILWGPHRGRNPTAKIGGPSGTRKPVL